MLEVTFCLRHKEARALSLCAITTLMLLVGPGEPAAEGRGLQGATHCCQSRAQAGLYGLVTPDTAFSLSHAEKRAPLSPRLYLSPAETSAHSWWGDRRGSQGLAVVPVFSLAEASSPVPPLSPRFLSTVACMNYNIVTPAVLRHCCK